MPCPVLSSIQGKFVVNSNHVIKLIFYRKQITQLTKEKSKLEEELGDAQLALTQEKGQHATLKRAFTKVNEELSQAQVCPN